MLKEQLKIPTKFFKNLLEIPIRRLKKMENLEKKNAISLALSIF